MANRGQAWSDLRGPDYRYTTTIMIPSVSVVIPTLNEAENLRTLLPMLPRWIFELIIVDGHSTDGTISVVNDFGKDFSVKVLAETVRGKGAALRAGFNAAQGDIILALDADCSMHPREMLVLVGALLAGADLVKGSRFLQGGGTSDMSVVRMTGNWALTNTVRLLFGGSFTDLCYGYFAFWRRHLTVLEPTCLGFEVETFVKLQALKAGLKISEVPSFEFERKHGSSNLRALPDGMRILGTILRERFLPGRSAVPHEPPLGDPLVAPPITTEQGR
jgi:glycosyltransferase involved in cell wall biosynthesis